MFSQRVNAFTHSAKLEFEFEYFIISRNILTRLLIGKVIKLVRKILKNADFFYSFFHSGNDT